MIKKLNPHSQSPSDVKKRNFIPEPYKKVARAMEAQFAEYMVNQMRKTSGAQASDTATSFYNSVMDSERAKSMSETNSLGIQDVILDQIYPMRLRNEMTYNFQQRKSGQMAPKGGIQKYEAAQETQGGVQ